MALDYDDFRADIGDKNSAFDDPDIDRLEERAIVRYGVDAAYEGARVLAIQQLMVNSATFAKYTANESSEDRTNIFKNFKDVLAMYKEDLNDVLEGVAGSNVRMGNTNKKPPRRKEYPDA